MMTRDSKWIVVGIDTYRRVVCGKDMQVVTEVRRKPKDSERWEWEMLIDSSQGPDGQFMDAHNQEEAMARADTFLDTWAQKHELSAPGPGGPPQSLVLPSLRLSTDGEEESIRTETAVDLSTHRAAMSTIDVPVEYEAEELPPRMVMALLLGGHVS